MIVMNTRIYLRASTKDQDAKRALRTLQDLNQNLNLGETIVYVENYSMTGVIPTHQICKKAQQDVGLFY